MKPARNVINLDRIRGRVSYRLFREAADMLTRPYERETFLRWLYGLLDNRHGFGSQSNADWARESLEQLLKDLGDSTCLEKCPACGEELLCTGIEWQGAEGMEFGEQCPGCGRVFETTFAAVRCKEVKP